MQTIFLNVFIYFFLLSNFKVINLNEICFITKLDMNINIKKCSKHKMYIKQLKC